MNDGNAFDDLDACEARIDIRGGAVLSDPTKHVFNRAGIFDPLTIAGDGGGRMKSRAHEISVACASARYIAMHGAGNRVVFDEISIGGRFDWGKTFGFVDGDFAGALCAQTGPSLYLVPEREHGVLLFVLTSVDRESLSGLPAPDRAFAPVQVARYLLPRFQSFLWGVPLRH